MKKTDISTCKWAKWLLDGLVLLAIIFIGYKLTSQYEVHALCLDDFSFSRLFEKSYFAFSRLSAFWCLDLPIMTATRS